MITNFEAMASDDVHVNLYSCVNDPNFTIICMFLEKFADACGIYQINIADLSAMLENNKEVDPALEDMHVKLLRKINKKVPSGKWENALAKFAHTYSNQDAWEIERFGYKTASLAVKLRILKELLETQFDRNVKFKGYINNIAAEDLRSDSIGSDIFGNMYWCIMDRQCNIRVFRDNQDDEIWSLVASNRDEVVHLVEKLKLLEPDATFNHDFAYDDTSSNSTSLHSLKVLHSNRDAKDPSLILDRRVYKKDMTDKSCKDEIPDAPITNEVVVNNSKHSEKTTQRDELIKNSKGSSHATTFPQIIVSGTNSTVVDSPDINMEDSAIANEYEHIVVSDAVEEPKIIITEQGSGADCESSPIFSEVIEESTRFVYGQGYGVEYDIGNIKIGDNSSCSTTHSDSKKTDQILSPDGTSKSVETDLHYEESDVKQENCKRTEFFHRTNPKQNYVHSSLSTEGNIVKETLKNSKNNAVAPLTANSIGEGYYVMNKVFSNKSDEKCLKQNSARTSSTRGKKNLSEHCIEDKNEDIQILTDIDQKNAYCETFNKFVKHENSVNLEKCNNEIKAINAYETVKKIQTETNDIGDNNTKCTIEDEVLNQSNTVLHSKTAPIKSNIVSNFDKTKNCNIDIAFLKKNTDKVFYKKKHDAELNIAENVSTTTKKGRKSKFSYDGLDISHVIIDKLDSNMSPVRQSRRIAQQKIREESNRRLIEEKMLREMKEEAIKKRKTSTLPPSEDEDYVESDDESTKNMESKVKKKNTDKPWLTSSSESSSESELEDYFIDQEHSDERQSSLKSDHEFSPESDLEGETLVLPKRARTVRPEKDIDDAGSIDFNLDNACQKCGKSDHPEWILLCDSCDKGYHCSCLLPVLFIIPEGDWFCPVCQHEKLIAKLQSKLSLYDEYKKQLDLDDALQKQQFIKEKDKIRCTKPDEVVRKRKSESSIRLLDEKSDSHASEKDGNGNLSTSKNNTPQNRSDESDTDTEDVRTYKLRRRNQTNLNYRFNDYDDLINSAIHRSTNESTCLVSGAKDIRNIVEAEKKEKVKQRRILSMSPEDGNKTHIKNEISKKKKKLNNLDISSEDDDGSDEDFKGAVTSTDDEESFSMTEDSESSLEQFRSRKSRTARKKKYDMDFINDDDSDKSVYNIRTRPKKIKKIIEDSEESDEEEVTESEEIDSEELCNDTETDSSEDNRNRKISPANKIKQLTKKVSNNNKKKKHEKHNDDKPYRSGFKDKLVNKQSDSDASDVNKAQNDISKRRTRGKKLHYIIDDDFESSDDGITPGVQRPDTPPEERERFIKKQEEIKRMLAEKNTAAAKELATPKIKPLSGTNDKNQPAALSTVPPQIIESAKILDIDFLKSSRNIDSDEMDEELTVNFPDPDDVNEDELAKIMEDEDFAQHQLKLDDEDIPRNKCITDIPKKKSINLDNIKPLETAEKKIGLCERLHRDDAANRIAEVESTPNYIHHTINESDTLTASTLLNYQNVLPHVTCTSSLLQQMKQQAIPLDDSQNSLKLIQSSSSFTNEETYTSPSVPVILSLSDANKPMGSSESKDSPDLRRRRRKKITPLRGDLYKLMENRSLDPPKQMHFNLSSTTASNSLPESSAIVYVEQKLHTNMITSTHALVTNNTKPELGLRFTNSNPYVSTHTYRDEFDHPPSNETTILPTSSTGKVNDQHSKRAFVTIEPVNTEDLPTEQATDIVEHKKIYAESSSEFSGLVSYFSSQQNELNA